MYQRRISPASITPPSTKQISLLRDGVDPFVLGSLEDAFREKMAYLANLNFVTQICEQNPHVLSQLNDLNSLSLDPGVAGSNILLYGPARKRQAEIDACVSFQQQLNRKLSALQNSHHAQLQNLQAGRQAGGSSNSSAPSSPQQRRNGPYSPLGAPVQRPSLVLSSRPSAPRPWGAAMRGRSRPRLPSPMARFSRGAIPPPSPATAAPDPPVGLGLGDSSSHVDHPRGHSSPFIRTSTSSPSTPSADYMDVSEPSFSPVSPMSPADFEEDTGHHLPQGPQLLQLHAGNAPPPPVDEEVDASLYSSEEDVAMQLLSPALGEAIMQYTTTEPPEEEGNNGTPLLSQSQRSQFPHLPPARQPPELVQNIREVGGMLGNVPLKNVTCLMHCKNCLCPLLDSRDVMSSNYRIATGRAFLCQKVFNLYEEMAEEENCHYTTGMFKVGYGVAAMGGRVSKDRWRRGGGGLQARHGES